MSRLYIISGATGMTGNELSRQLVRRGDRVIGFDNFFASSLDTVKDILDDELFTFYEYDINNDKQMADLRSEVLSIKDKDGILVEAVLRFPFQDELVSLFDLIENRLILYICCPGYI